MATKKQAENPEEMMIPVEEQEPHTGENPELAQMLSDEESSEFQENITPAQTDSESAEVSIPSESTNQPLEAAASQTETEPVKKARRRKKTAAESAQSDTEIGPDSNAADDDIEHQSKSKIKLSYPRPNVKVLSIDERRTVETETDRAKNDLLDLIESQKSGRILTDTIQGVETSVETPGLSFAVLYHGEFKVIIPVTEAVNPPVDYRDQDPDEVHRYMLTKRLGAEVDYIVKGIDPTSGIAAASRLDAMRVRRKEFYFGTDRDGNNLIYPDVCAEARVVSVIRAGIFVDLFGLEIYIPLKELSYQRWLDASVHFQPGQRTLVKVLEVDRSDRNNIKVTASVKQASENPYEKALRKYSIGNRYVGTVSMVDTNGVFVALDSGIDCLCSYPKRGRPPRGAHVTVKILGINHETNRIWGAITHIAIPR